jgi:4-amino-4-deoxy-L-arabinose transferase-like glycosyltransferase
LIILILAVFALGALLFLLPTLWQRLLSPVQLQQADAINVERALILLRGGNLYPDSAHGGPYLYTAYPPLFYWIEALLLKIIPQNLWLPGRILAFAGYIGSGFLLAFWARRRWGWNWAVLLASLFLIFPTWIRWGTVDRPDALFIFLNFSAFLLLYLEETKPGPRFPAGKILGAGLLNAASILIKQSSLTLTLAYGAYCLWKRRWKKLGLFLAASLIPVAAVGAWENAQSGGLFFLHTFLWLHTGYHWDLLWSWISAGFIHETWWLLILMVPLLLVRKIHPLLICQLLFSTIALLSLGREGGAENYWLEFSLYGIFLIGEGYHSRPAPSYSSPAWRNGISWAVVMILLAGLCSSLLLARPGPVSADTITMKNDAVKFLGRGENLVLDTDLALMAGQKVWIQPMEYTAMVDQGFWPVGPLVQDIKNKKFDTIELYDLARQYLLPQPVVDEINLDYHPVLKKYGRVWLAPNP